MVVRMLTAKDILSVVCVSMAALASRTMKRSQGRVFSSVPLLAQVKDLRGQLLPDRLQQNRSASAFSAAVELDK
eukprot:6467396-Amphidinium_carterae.1